MFILIQWTKKIYNRLNQKQKIRNIQDKNDD